MSRAHRRIDGSEETNVARPLAAMIAGLAVAAGAPLHPAKRGHEHDSARSHEPQRRQPGHAVLRNGLLKVELLLLAVLAPLRAMAEELQVTLGFGRPEAELAPQFLGFSYESAMLLPASGEYYFSPKDKAVMTIFKTLGIRSLRIGGSTVDRADVPVPGEPDIDALFSFAKEAGVKIIYSLRLKDGDPESAARLAKYISDRYPDALDCFAIGNEPDQYLGNYHKYLAAWDRIYKEILRQVPSARFDGPCVAGRSDYVLDMARDIHPAGHLAMASNHYYFLGSGRTAEHDPENGRRRFLSDDALKTYQRDYGSVGEKLAGNDIPYRIDEVNNCFGGGAKNVSDTYASALWALDCTHWWAAHHILGLNYHTGDYLRGHTHYTSFRSSADGIEACPMSYGLLAFSQGAHGRIVPVQFAGNRPPGVTAYAYAAPPEFYVTVINKTHGADAQTVDASIPPEAGMAMDRWEQMDLTQKDCDPSAKTGIEMGGAEIAPEGDWPGQWRPVQAESSRIRFKVAPATAAILRLKGGFASAPPVADPRVPPR
jgi:hypothetical protein